MQHSSGERPLQTGCRSGNTTLLGRTTPANGLLIRECRNPRTNDPSKRVAGHRMQHFSDKRPQQTGCRSENATILGRTTPVNGLQVGECNTSRTNDPGKRLAGQRMQHSSDERPQQTSCRSENATLLGQTTPVNGLQVRGCNTPRANDPSNPVAGQGMQHSSDERPQQMGCK